ncbi:MAG: protoporphyrinogen oxidase-like protein [Candidatus Omnitrophica bacterium]|nr:protoporphyrinogen oxidase-like protein [Candidatus Omnitrophota bacterium]
MQAPKDKEAYRFEIGGGHWIFGADQEILKFIQNFTSVRSYFRSSAVYFSKKDLYVPYPLQNNLRYLGRTITKKALEEISNRSKGACSTMKEWLIENFGLTLCKIFFFPFHNLYTAGLYKEIAPQDNYKTPIDISKILQGASQEVAPVGYNLTFIYPKYGLDVLVQNIAKCCDIHYEKQVIKIDAKHKEVYFADGSTVPYSKLISTLPLNKVIEMSAIKISDRPDPYTSILVLNIGALRGKKCPSEHWLYIPDSRSGFYRVGFYSNVDLYFLPKSLQRTNNRVSIYVEKAYLGGQKLSDKEIKIYTNSVISELQEWDFIRDVEVVDSTWIDVAYTWSWPRSQWKEKALNALEAQGIYQIGRYGRWKFQGIADSIRDGLMAEKHFRNS